MTESTLVNSPAHIENEFCCWFYFYHLLHPQSHNKYIKYVCYFHIRFELHWLILYISLHVCVCFFKCDKNVHLNKLWWHQLLWWCGKQWKQRDKIHLQLIKRRKRSIHSAQCTHTNIWSDFYAIINSDLIRKTIIYSIWVCTATLQFDHIHTHTHTHIFTSLNSNICVLFLCKSPSSQRLNRTVFFLFFFALNDLYTVRKYTVWDAAAEAIHIFFSLDKLG